jgi:2-dehydropantoate 2-reductase
LRKDFAVVNILVAGCGAIGGLYAARLSRHARVTALDIDTGHVAAIERDGLRLSGATELVARIRAVSQPELLHGEVFDAVIVAVKSMDTAALAATLKAHLAGAPLVLTQQNGQGNVAALLAALDWDVAQGMTMEAAEVLAPGCVRHHVHGAASTIGPARGELSAMRWLGELLDAAGLPTRVLADPRGEIWNKYLFNCAINPVAALLRGIPEAKYANDDVYALLRGLVEEGLAVARALGIPVAGDPLHLVEDIRAGRRPLPRHPGSMAIDIERGRPIEIEALNGYLVRRADELGIAVPLQRAMYRLLKGLESGLKLTRAGAGAAAIPR